MIGVGEKTPTPDGPPVTVGCPVELVTAVDGAVVPVDNSPVVVVDDDDDGALVDEVVPEPPVVETASCARTRGELAVIKSSANKTANRCLISRVARFEPRLEQETRNRFMTTIESLTLIVCESLFVQVLWTVRAFAIG